MKEVQIKELNLKLTTIRAENAKNEEILSTLKEHKEFLDKLVPKVTWLFAILHNFYKLNKIFNALIFFRSGKRKRR